MAFILHSLGVAAWHEDVQHMHSAFSQNKMNANGVPWNIMIVTPLKATQNIRIHDCRAPVHLKVAYSRTLFTRNNLTEAA